ncbi:hypothetical protein [Castellaniella ginsengisoli]|uniref:Glycosylase n=1 Tax=Castellaniella ginsengisoli TaxID=546114 RepID=A0AB39D666_9BURK
MFKWKKLGKIFDPRDCPGQTWMDEFAQSASSIVLDDRVRVFFCSRPKPEGTGMYLSYMAYIDLDRRDLTRLIGVSREPLLSLGKKGTFDEFGTNPISIVKDGDALRVYYAGWTRCESVPINGAIGVAVSHDGGESFQRLGDGPVISYSPDEPFMMGSPRVRRFNDLWQLWYVSGKRWLKTDGKPEPVYKIRMATSNDGLEWAKQGRDLLEDRLGPDECQACPDVTFRDGRYHMFYSYRHAKNYKVKESGYRIGYACSSDMLIWHRNDDLVDIRLSPAGWDSEMISYPHLFELDGATYMLYQGNGMGRTGLGLARLESEGVWGRS